MPEPPQSAAYLRCPRCDAAVSDGATRCEYCDTELLVKACPRCFGRVFSGCKHCRHCGAPVEAPAAADPNGDATPRMCPRCADRNVALEGRLVDEYLLDECNDCGGVYVDAATLERILVDRRQASVTAAAGLGVGASAGGALQMNRAGRPRGPMYVRCPDCERLMNRKNFGETSGVIIDVCSPHGTWFDADELPRVIAFVQSGGLEKAERRILDREREQVRAARSSVINAHFDAELPLGGGADNNAIGLLHILRRMPHWFGW